MDPRHPEQAISRMRELMKQYDRIEKDMNKATTSAQLAQLEREGGLVVQEICLVAPRIHEAMMQTSRQRRHDLSRGVVEKPVEKIITPVEAIGLVEDLELVSTNVKNSEDKISFEIEQIYKPKKKTTRKKKTAKKVEKKGEK